MKIYVMYIGGESPQVTTARPSWKGDNVDSWKRFEVTDEQLVFLRRLGLV